MAGGSPRSGTCCRRRVDGAQADPIPFGPAVLPPPRPAAFREAVIPFADRLHDPGGVPFVAGGPPTTRGRHPVALVSEPGRGDGGPGRGGRVGMAPVSWLTSYGIGPRRGTGVDGPTPPPGRVISSRP